MTDDTCSDCKGFRTIIDPLSGDEEPYTCPCCGGSGKASDCIGPEDFDE